jgi:hypothetical protein
MVAMGDERIRLRAGNWHALPDADWGRLRRASSTAGSIPIRVSKSIAVSPRRCSVPPAAGPTSWVALTQSTVRTTLTLPSTADFSR